MAIYTSFFTGLYLDSPALMLPFLFFVAVLLIMIWFEVFSQGKYKLNWEKYRSWPSELSHQLSHLQHTLTQLFKSFYRF
uniref:Uncharacterized protein n=1 Tax=Magnetococcus massalia (strain MO-1) TaxID=451514 RepID=A0A1S7LHB8_MAGMO|nr:Protein of unknown function [Candidatus Magnetococcus massalia]